MATQAAKLSAVDELVQAKLLDETATTDTIAALADSYLEALERGTSVGWSLCTSAGVSGWRLTASAG